jgi:hypothetical protein
MDEFTHYNSAPTIFGVFSVLISPSPFCRLPNAIQRLNQESICNRKYSCQFLSQSFCNIIQPTVTEKKTKDKIFLSTPQDAKGNTLYDIPL